ncbi:Uncharacterised protein [Vibrio cholerae]|nr:Uncharacterised protein [Vibrio cholerae]
MHLSRFRRGNLVSLARPLLVCAQFGQTARRSCEIAVHLLWSVPTLYCCGSAKCCPYLVQVAEYGGSACW